MGIYSRFEDKWYSFLDKVNSKIPIYKLIDPIDRIIPSFLLFLIVLILFFSIGLFFIFGLGNYTYTLVILDEDEQVLSNVNFEFMGDNSSSISGRTNQNGTFVFASPQEYLDGNLLINDPNYSEYNVYWTLEPGTNTIVLRASRPSNNNDRVPPPTSKELSIGVYNEYDRRSVIEDVQLVFVCSSSSLNEPVVAPSGRYSFSIPVDCGVLSITASKNGFETKTSSVDSSISSISIFLRPLDISASLKIFVKNFDKSAVENASIKVFDSVGNLVKNLNSDSFGAVEFDIDAGSYKISASSNSGGFAEKNIVVNVGSDDIHELVLSKPDLSKKLFFRIVNSSSDVVENASVKIFKNGILFKDLVSSSSGIIEQGVPEGNNKFDVVVFHDSYVLKVVNNIGLRTSSEGAVDVVLNSADSSNVSFLKVFLVDEFSNPIDNAIVSLKLDSNLMLFQKSSDSNGSVVFSNLYSGNFVVNASVSGKEASERIFIPTGSNKELMLNLVVGTGSVSVKVMDAISGELINADVDLYSNNEVIASGSSVDGIISFSDIDHGTIVVAKASMNGFYSKESYEELVVISNSVQNVNLFLFPDSFIDSIENDDNLLVQFMGLFEDKELTSKNVFFEGNSKYYALFFVIAKQEFSNAVANFRVGSEELIQIGNNSPAKIMNAYSSSGNVVLSSSINVNNVFDSPSVVSSVAKLANVSYGSLEERSIQQVIVEFDVADLADGSSIPFYWQSRASDDGLEIFSVAYFKEFVVGENICEWDCPELVWSTFLKFDDSRIKLEPFDNFVYNLVPEKNYEIEISLFNNTQQAFFSELVLDNYPNALNFGQDIPFSVEEFSINPFETHLSSVSFFTSEKGVAFSFVDLNLMDADVSPSHKKFLFSVRDKNALGVLLGFSEISANTEYDMFYVRVFDVNSMFAVSGASVNIYAGNSNNAIISSSDEGTDVNGFFRFKLPAQNEGNLRIVVSKSGFISKEVLLPVVNTPTTPIDEGRDIIDTDFACVNISESGTLIDKASSSFASFSITNNCTQDYDFVISSPFVDISSNTFSVKSNTNNLVRISNFPYQGQYPVYVYAALPSGNVLLKQIEIVVKDSSSCFEISDTEFDISNDIATGQITNKCSAHRFNIFYPQAVLDSSIVLFDYDKPGIPDKMEVHWAVSSLKSEQIINEFRKESYFFNQCEGSGSGIGGIIGSLGGGIAGYFALGLGLPYALLIGAVVGAASGGTSAAIMGEDVMPAAMGGAIGGAAATGLSYGVGHLMGAGTGATSVGEVAVADAGGYVTPTATGGINTVTGASASISSGTPIYQATSAGTAPVTGLQTTAKPSEILGGFMDSSGKLSGMATLPFSTSLLTGVFSLPSSDRAKAIANSENDVVSGAEGELASESPLGSGVVVIATEIGTQFASLLWSGAMGMMEGGFNRLERNLGGGKSCEKISGVYMGWPYDTEGYFHGFPARPEYIAEGDEGIMEETMSYDYSIRKQGGDYHKIAYYMQGPEGTQTMILHTKDKGGIGQSAKAFIGVDFSVDSLKHWNGFRTDESSGSAIIVPLPGEVYELGTYSADVVTLWDEEDSIEFCGQNVAVGQTIECGKTKFTVTNVEPLGIVSFGGFQPNAIEERKAEEYLENGELYTWVTAPGEGSEVVVWLANGVVYGEYVGDTSDYNGVFDFNIMNIALDGEEYALLTVADYDGRKSNVNNSGDSNSSNTNLNDSNSVRIISNTTNSNDSNSSNNNSTDSNSSSLVPDIVTEQFLIKLKGNPVSCVAFDGTKGISGIGAIPKLKFSWDWDSISGDQCLINNPSGTYCDATQFSIMLLKRLEAIRNLLTNNDVANATALQKFDTYLIKDGFSADFQSDFDYYYNNESLFSPTFFTDSEMGLSKIFGSPTYFSFNSRTGDVEPLPFTGIYRVDIDLEFLSDSQTFFLNGEPNVKIVVNIDLLYETASRNPLYNIPFNGSVGKRENEFHRDGYGVSLDGEELKINNQEVLSFNNSGTALKNLDIVSENSINYLNQTNRGNLLKISNSTIEFSPSNITPVFGVVNSEDPNMFYSIQDSNQSISMGAYGSFWSGFSSSVDPAMCSPFSDEATLRETADSLLGEVSSSCSLITNTNRSNVYGISFDSGEQGVISNSAIFYSPIDKVDVSLVDACNGSSYFTSDPRIVLNNGVSLNYSSEVLNYVPSSVESLFDGLEQGYLCSGLNGDNELLVWWNENKIMDLVEGNVLPDERDNFCFTDAAAEQAIQKLLDAQKSVKWDSDIAPIVDVDMPAYEEHSSSSSSSAGSTENYKNGPTNGFVWKPVSESDRKLVVLFPSSMKGIKSVAIYQNEKVVEKGKYSGIHNGNRAHFRFSRPGSAFNNVYLIATMNDGINYVYKISNGGNRIG